jgi:glyoxylase-like metal-dependent hydrolase (beta-lactamase superfamily II)
MTVPMKYTTIQLGITKTYLIQSEGTVYIDAGVSINPKKFEQKISNIIDDPTKIELIIITHGHFDHIGNLKTLKELSGAKIVIHEKDQRALTGETLLVPPGRTLWGNISKPILNHVLAPFIETEKIQPDIVIKNEQLDLSAYGVPGYVIYTPGHTEGSLSVVIDDDVFVGDLAMNALYLSRKPRPSIFTCDISKLRSSWETLIDRGVKNVYPSHGASFHISKILHEIQIM